MIDQMYELANLVMYQSLLPGFNAICNCNCLFCDRLQGKMLDIYVGGPFFRFGGFHPLLRGLG